MERQKDEIEIDLLKLIKALWHRAWAIALAAIICAGMAFSYAAFRIIPMYQASALMYVNNSTVSLSSGFAISPGELAAAQSLVDSYVVILKSRNTLNEVIERADLSYTYEQMCSMVSASAVNETEIFSVSVLNPDPQEAELIANTIAEVLPEKIADIVDGSSVRVVDYAVVPSRRISPNVTKYTEMGMLLGIFVSCAIIVICSLLDTTITSEEYLTQNYEIPVLAVIPDLSSHKGRKYGYYKSQPYQKPKEGK
ncbi:MAG: Wzz/FepE/Etk N-terminal domain-containing protein [Eubacteriales bacterium]|nr:Wzz/FepE/Etk N-terminal domain-containing protein [Eubacteriales bacterium]